MHRNELAMRKLCALISPIVLLISNWLPPARLFYELRLAVVLAFMYHMQFLRLSLSMY